VIASFGDKTTEDIYHGRDTAASRKLSRTLWERIQSQLDILNAAVSLQDLRSPPSNHLEKLRGDLSGLHGIGINRQYRLVFRFTVGNCSEVRRTDYQ
jgi:proteic killer suppression protein